MTVLLAGSGEGRVPRKGEEEKDGRDVWRVVVVVVVGKRVIGGGCE